MANKTLRVGVGPFRGHTNIAIQKAVDAVAKAGGGTVVIPAGTYTMRNCLRLRSGVRVVGEAGAVLRRVPSVESRITDYLGYGHYEFTVAEPEKFNIGDGVHLSDANSMGFYNTQATVTGKRGDLIFIDRMLNHDYGTAGRAATLFSVVEGENIHDASIRDVTLDGHADETRTLSGCRGGGVFLIGCHNVRLDGVEVLNFKGDAISFQQCTDTDVRRCHVHHNTGCGLHPGSGSVRYLLEENHSHDNGRDGLFYCLRTTHSICRNNRFENNAGCGISVGERDTDHLIEHNTITGNMRHGVEFRRPNARGGDRVRLQHNIIGPNCRSGTDAYEIAVPSQLRDILIAENTINTDGHKALVVEPRCDNVVFANNTVNGRSQRRGDAAGNGCISTRLPCGFPPVGPAALPLDGARHLNIPKLPRWRNP